jgi:hypothetical protein
MRLPLARISLLAALVVVPTPLAAQPGDVYAGKTLRVVVGLEAGGTVDTLARTFSVHLRKHIPGNPAIIVQNMPGAGANSRPHWRKTNSQRKRCSAKWWLPTMPARPHPSPSSAVPSDSSHHMCEQPPNNQYRHRHSQ